MQRIFFRPYFPINAGQNGVAKKLENANIEIIRPQMSSFIPRLKASEEYKGAINEYPIAEEILIKNRIMISFFII